MQTRKQLNLAALAATTLVVAACGGKSHDATQNPPAGNTPPTVSAIVDQSANQDTVVGPLDFGISDDHNVANELTVTASADGTNLFPADGVVIGGSGATRNITLTPLESATGASNITISVIDGGGLITTRTFAVTVNARAASVRDAALTTFAKSASADPTPVNGFTFTQDADDPAVFDPLIGAGQQ